MTRIPDLRPSDIRGIAQLATQATIGASRIAEGVHQSVWDTLGVPGGTHQGRTGGITGLAYKAVRGITALAGTTIDSAIGLLQSTVVGHGTAGPSSPGRETVLAALNGVLGDHLADTGNPLATPMTMQLRDRTLKPHHPPARSEVSGKILLLIHGLCMSDLHWRRTSENETPGIGESLESSLGYTPVSVRYNSGLHTSQNGQDLSLQIERLIDRWPTAVDELTVVAHSMGGLVIRSAVHSAVGEARRWPPHLKNIVFLGTPHHGAPLEQAGNWVDTILGSNRYTAPFARLGHVRSAGITDLRYGHVVDEDWQGRDRFQLTSDTRKIVPLPEGVSCFAVAATTASRRSLVADRLLGDGLVPLDSALGRHADDRRRLDFPQASQHIEYRTKHVQLLTSPRVTARIVKWLAASGGGDARDDRSQ